MSWENQTINTVAFEKQSLNEATFTAQTGQTADIDKGIGFLLNELAGYILQENGGKIVLEESWNYKQPIIWSDQAVSSDSWSNQSRS